MLSKLNISDMNKKILEMLFIYFLVVLVISFVFFTNKYEYMMFSFGLTTGVLVCSLKMVLLEKMLDKAMAMDEKSSQKYAASQFAFRQALQFILLVVVAIISVTSLYGALLSFMCLQMAVYTANYFMKEKQKSVK